MTEVGKSFATVLLRSQPAKDFVTFRSHIKLIPLQVYASERISVSAIHGQLRSKQVLSSTKKSCIHNDLHFLAADPKVHRETSGHWVCRANQFNYKGLVRPG